MAEVMGPLASTGLEQDTGSPVPQYSHLESGYPDLSHVPVLEQAKYELPHSRL
jgi:hypothetical protein